MVICFFFDVTEVAVRGHYQNHGVASASSSAASGYATYGNTDKVPSAAASSNYGHESGGASGNGKAGVSMMVHTKTNYDAIFNVRVLCDVGDRQSNIIIIAKLDLVYKFLNKIIKTKRIIF